MPPNTIASMLARHEAAGEILARYEQEGLPFALYLRDFSRTRIVGPHEMDVAPIYNRIASQMPEGCGLLYVQNRKAGYAEDFKHFRTTEKIAAGLMLDDSEWADVVTHLVARASIIFCEASSYGDGTQFEVRRIVSAQQVHKSVLFLPAFGDFGLPLLDASPHTRQFLRVCYDNDLPGANYADHPSIADLMARIRDIAQRKSAREDQCNAMPQALTPPVTYAGVARGHSARAWSCDIDENEAARARFAEGDLGLPVHGQTRADLFARARMVAFWSYWRCLSVYEYVQAVGAHP